SNSELLRIKNKQKTTYKNQKTASSYKKRHKNGLMTDLGLRTGKQNNRHLIIPPKKRHPEVPNVSFFILLSAPEACLYRSGLPTKTFVASHA
ncbi:MAG: hypothetical protein UHO69_02670, partial [Prevotella sp.]|nr:hypothetical protein [Prevotella sp.]